MSRWTPLYSLGGPNGPTERAQIKSCLMEMDITVDGGSGHLLLLRTNMLLLLLLLLCRCMCKRLSLVLIWLASPRFWTDPNTVFTYCRNGTNERGQPRSVPFGSTRSTRVKARPYLHFVFVSGALDNKALHVSEEVITQT